MLRTTQTGLAYHDHDHGHGHGHGPVILMIHGWGVSGALFEDLAARLSGEYRVLAPDLPGHGDSPPLGEGFRFEDFADAIAVLVNELALEKPCLVGWSMGAMVCWDLLERHPEVEVLGLMCIDMVPRVLNGSSWTMGLRNGVGPEVFDAQAERMCADWPAYTERFVPRIFAPEPLPTTAAAIAETRRVALANDPHSMALAWGAMCTQDFRDALGRVSVPACVVAGQHSQLYGPRAAHWVAKAMPGAEVALYERSGHAPHLEEPERFARDLARFAQRVQGRPSDARRTPNAVNENLAEK